MIQSMVERKQMDDEPIFKNAIKAGKNRITAALRVARSTSPSAARMTLEEARRFVVAYHVAIDESRPKRLKGR